MRFFIKIAPLQKFSAKGLRAVWVTCGFAEWLPAAVYLRLLDMHCKGIPVDSNKLFAKMSRKICTTVIEMSDQIPPCVFSDFVLSEGRMATGYANTATIISFSVQQNADGMLNLLLTDKAPIGAPMSAFVISDQGMVSAFWDYLAGMIR